MQTTGSSRLRVLDDGRMHLVPAPAAQGFSPKCGKCTSRQSGHFCNLGGSALAEFEASSMPQRLQEDGILFMEGQPSSSVSFICEGRLKLTRSSRHGKTLLVRIAQAGEALGLSGALANLPHEVTAQAIEPVQLRTMQRQAFLDFLRRHGEGSLRAAETLGRKYRAVINDTYRLALSTSIAGRVAHLLLEFARDSETGEDPQPAIHMALKHEELAFKLGSTRESVTRVLNNFKRDGVLSVKGTRMVLLNKTALAALV